MNSNLSELQHRREQILQEMAAIDRLRRGHLSQQFRASTQHVACKVAADVAGFWHEGHSSSGA